MADLFHERLVAAWVGKSHYVVVSPDHELFMEQLHANNGIFTSLRIGDDVGKPVGLSAREIYASQPRSVGQSLAGLLR